MMTVLLACQAVMRSLYPYIHDVFTDIFGYAKDHIRIEEKGGKGTPDFSLVSEDASPKNDVFWVVGER